jgi:hypothetical protein
MTMVDVIVDRGVVILWGVVRNEEEKNAIRVAAELAAATTSLPKGTSGRNDFIVFFRRLKWEEN